jgi:thymidylate synthase ThyX
MIQAKVVCDSVSPKGERLTTVEIELHRLVLAENNTHRVLSRNYQSSRACPVEQQIERILVEPALPVYYGKNQAGMQSKESLSEDEIEEAEKIILEMRDFCVEKVKILINKEGLNLHKQTAARYLEPFMWTKGIITATEKGWESFFKLRCHHLAQPEIQVLAYKIQDEMRKSAPQKLEYGEWHIPYVRQGRCPKTNTQMFFDIPNKRQEQLGISLEDAVKVSTSCCAQVSYRKLDNSLEKALDIYERLNLPSNGNYLEDAPHCYDGETEVLTENGFIKWKELKDEALAVVDPKTSTFKGFQGDYTKIQNNYKGEYFHYVGKNIDLLVTAGHSLYGHRILKQSDRNKENYQLFAANTPWASSSRSENSVWGESPLKMLKSAKPNYVGLDEIKIEDISLYKLYGFFIGDGSFPSDGSVNCIRFHIKKKRKKEYLNTILKVLLENGIVQDVKYYGNHINVKIEGAKKTFSKFYNKDRKKTFSFKEFAVLPSELFESFLDGLKNSDGSVSDDSWTYSTSSKELKDNIINLCTLHGTPVTISNTVEHDNPNHNTNWVLSLWKKDYILVNDSRSQQSFNRYSSESVVYCANTGGNVLVVRRNGKIILSGNCSPAEHCAMCYNSFEEQAFGNEVSDWSGNFQSKDWHQYRKMLERGNEMMYLEK